MTFDQWLNENEKYTVRIERLYEDIDIVAGVAKSQSEAIRNRSLMLGWLKAAYEQGHEHAVSKLEDDGK